jgi:hypothetical protein
MANPATTTNDPNKVELGNNAYEDKVLLSGENASANSVLGEVSVAAGTATADAGNTGDGTVTGLALVAAGGPAKIGSYILICTDAESGDALTGAAVADAGNTGNGTVTSIVTTSPAKQGAYILKCTDADAGGTASAGTVTPDGGNTGDGVAGTATPSTNVKEGTYVMTCIEAIANSGRFEVVDPDGDRLEDLYIATAYSNTHFALTIADGATDFIVGDIFTMDITIAHGGKFSFTDPNGNLLEDTLTLPGGAGGTLAVDVDGVAFTLTDGSTDFAVDDFFTITVTGSHGGKFRLTDPNGVVLKNDIILPGSAGGTVVFTGAGITFTITDGATDFVLNDFFTITVTAGSGKLKVATSTNTDGSQIAKYILPNFALDASLADKACRVMKGGEARSLLLVFGGSDDEDTVVNGQTQKEHLRDFGIQVIDDVVNDRLEP